MEGSGIVDNAGWNGPELILDKHPPSNREAGERYLESTLLLGWMPIGLSLTNCAVSHNKVLSSFKVSLLSPMTVIKLFITPFANLIIISEIPF